MLLRVSDRILLHASDLVRCGRVTPQNVHRHLLNGVTDSPESDAQWPLDFVNVLKFNDRVTDSTMDAEDAILGHLISNDGTQRHPLEQIVHFLEDAIRVVDILAQPLGTLLSEP